MDNLDYSIGSAPNDHTGTPHRTIFDRIKSKVNEVIAALANKADVSSLSNYVLVTRKVNNKELSADITLTAADINVSGLPYYADSSSNPLIQVGENFGIIIRVDNNNGSCNYVSQNDGLQNYCGVNNSVQNQIANNHGYALKIEKHDNTKEISRIAIYDPTLTTLQGYLVQFGNGNFGLYSSDGISKIWELNDSGKLTTITAEIGGSGGSFKVANNGHITLFGTATVWEDDNIDPTMLTGGGNLPNQINFASTTIPIASFANATTDQVSACREIPHQCKLGSSIYFHSHVYPTTTDTGTLRLGLEYFFTLEGVAVTSSTTIYAESAMSGTAWAKKSVTFNSITIPNELGSQFHFRFFRDGTHVNDTFTGDAAISTIGYHYELDSLGSNDILIK